MSLKKQQQEAQNKNLQYVFCTGAATGPSMPSPMDSEYEPSTGETIDERVAHNIRPADLEQLSAATLRELILDLHGHTIQPPADAHIDTLRQILAATMNGEY